MRPLSKSLQINGLQQSMSTSEQIGNKIFLTILALVSCFIIWVMFSDGEPSKTADEIIAQKLANGGELNWLDKKYLRDEYNANRRK